MKYPGQHSQPQIRAVSLLLIDMNLGALTPFVPSFDCDSPRSKPLDNGILSPTNMEPGRRSYESKMLLLFLNNTTAQGAQQSPTQ